jgi:hypothetical protein
MSLINRIKKEISELSYTKKNLRFFALGCFLLAGYFLFINLGKNSFYFLFSLSFFIVFFVFITFISPLCLKIIYTGWMLIFLLIGSIISRLTLIFLFYFILFPISVVARLFGENFINLEKKDTYWSRREKNKRINYEKLY